MVYVLLSSRTLQDTIDVLKAAKGAIEDTERMKAGERSDANVARSFQLAENQVEAAFISLRVRLSLRLRVLSHTHRSLPQGDLTLLNEAQDSREHRPQHITQVRLLSLADQHFAHAFMYRFWLPIKRGSNLVDVIVDIHQSNVPMRTLTCMCPQYSQLFD